ncbi:basic secretory family protein [Aneurinibacillus tyrosinisolvens]|uniref:basic secretory family protein n=1 Tax=Aneurinibacillus tyrosinisolvens TaxID=1443435 RepID=UPI000A909C50|nr:basic secretory family protein [Aneurinibacillus tyrosinisolvens]
MRFRFEKGVDKEVRRACIEFGYWLRNEFFFPVRIPIYIKSSTSIKALDGEYVSAVFFEPFDKKEEPYIKISTGEYKKSLIKNGKDDALAEILGSIVHELTHYYQWINDFKPSERQANNYISKILYEYSQTREHP